MPHAGNLGPPEFPSNYLPKAAEGEAPAVVPDKLGFNFFVPHETVCQNEKVRAALLPSCADPGHAASREQAPPACARSRQRTAWSSTAKAIPQGGAQLGSRPAAITCRWTWCCCQR